MPKTKKTDTPQTDEHGYTPENYQPLPNEEAIVSFNGKTLLTSESYLDVKAYQHALAFTVAGMMDEDLLAETRDAVKAAMENGTDFADFQKRLMPYLMSKGWLGISEDLNKADKDFVSRRLRTIFSTNLQTSYAAGQWDRIQQTKEFLPYLQYMPSVSENPRLSHKRYYGICRPVSDPIWQSIMPPNGYRCKCWVKQLTKRQAQKAGISDEKPLDTESYTNPKTGEKSDVPVGIDPSFNHNFDRLTSLLKLAEDKHGADFAEKLGMDVKNTMLDYALDEGEMSLADFSGILPRSNEIKRLMSEGVRRSEAEMTDQWQQNYDVRIVGYEQGVHKLLNPPYPPDLAEVNNKLPANEWRTLDIMYTLEPNADILEFNKSFNKSPKAWEKAKENIIKHINKADIVPMYLDHMDANTATKIISYVLSLPKAQQKKVVFVWGNKP